MRTLLLHGGRKKLLFLNQNSDKKLESPDDLSSHIHGANLAKTTNLVHFIFLWSSDGGEDKLFKEDFTGQMI